MPATGFSGFSDETLAFLNGLKANNSRDWFDANRKSYEAAVKAPSKAFSDIMAGELERLTGAAHKPKIFRINRDIRFSKDKTPYNAHIHISWMPVGGGEGAPAFMFGLSTEYCTLGCGTFEFPKPMLERYRETIAGARGEELGKMIDGLVADGYRLNEPALKRVPAGFPADHPRAALSLHKGLALWRDFESPQSATEPDLMRKCLGHFETLLPFWRFLSMAG
ncbi:DUF2461 domain-containing protein [Oricola sp.]|uniref:DUF2461 domain-containing protein n=1 Tax=Oricola sp. TaxID=1979950 RepID=UPI003516AB50